MANERGGAESFVDLTNASDDEEPVAEATLHPPTSTLAQTPARRGFGMVPTNPNANKQPTLSDQERWELFNERNPIPLSPGYPSWDRPGEWS